MSDYIVKRILNNSSLIVSDQGRDYVIIGKGIGFGKSTGDKLSKDIVLEEKFYAVKNEEMDSDSKIKQTAEITEIISEVLGVNVVGESLRSLSNHIFSMLQRLEMKQIFSNPFANETKILYKESYELSMKISERVHKDMGILIPEAEIGFLALYIHTLTSNEDQSLMTVVNVILSEISDLLLQKYKYEIDKESVIYSRFVIHVKFVIQRIVNDEPLENVDILNNIFDEYSKYQLVADDISKVIEDELGVKLNKTEKTYLLLYIARLVS